MNVHNWHVKILAIQIGVLLIGQVYCQIEFPGFPLGSFYDNNKDIPYLVIDSASLNQNTKYLAEDQIEKGFKIDFFAKTVKVDIDPNSWGKWDQLDTKTCIWRLGITSQGANCLAVTLDPYILPKGIKIFTYTPNGLIVAGAFTFRNNNPSKLLSITPLPGDSIIVEVQNLTGRFDIGQFMIETVSVGFSNDNFQKDIEDEWYRRSADCHVDINCIDDPEIQQQKYSTCRLIIERNDGRVRCTGTLLNNTSENFTPYVLTAGHCITDMYSAQRTIFYFNYESPYCMGPDGDLNSISGSILRSRSDYIDFALVELTEKPPVDYYPVYSGWDATGDEFEYSYTIHHPQGDVKKFANDSDRVEVGSFAPFDPGTQWLIPDYEIGTTEAGSSGGPLFDRNNHLVGTLIGGGIECTKPIYDYYQGFSYEWDAYSGEEEQAKVWLDPENTGVRVLDNLDPYLGLTEIISNIQSDDSLRLISMDQGWGYITGHNSLHSTSFAEHFYRNGSKYIYAMSLNAAKVYAADTNSTVTLMIWDGNEVPEEIVYEKELYLFELTTEHESIIRLDTLILVDRDFFVGYTINYSEPMDTFALLVAIHDSSYENTAFMSRTSEWEMLTDGDIQYSSGLAIRPMVLDYYPSTRGNFGEYPCDEVTLYPNPTYDILQILLKNKPENDVTLRVFDLIGNLLYKEKILLPEPNFQLQTSDILNQGMFLLKIEYDNYSSIKKFVKLQ